MSLRWLLAGSVCLNFFLAGVAIPPFMHGHGPFGPPRHHHPPGPIGMLEDLSEHINPADAAIMRQTLQQRGLDHPDPADMERLTTNLRAAIAAPDFDQTAFTDALDKLRAKRREEGDAVETALQQAVVAMSPEGRKQIADWLARGPKP